MGFYTDHDASGSKIRRGGDDLKVIRSKLDKLLSANDTAVVASRQKDRYENELLK